MESALLGMVLCGGLSASLIRSLSLFLGVDVAESVVASALGGGGGTLRDLNLSAPRVDTGGGMGGLLRRSSSSSRVGTPSADDSLGSLSCCY